MNYGYNFNPLFTRSMTPMINPTSVGSLAGSTSKITFSGILNGASKTLGVINQAIPVFYQVKPIWNNAKTMLRVIKGINSDNNSNVTNNIDNNINTISQKKEEQSAPTFFA